ncbi:MAG: hypothetical protein AB2L14_36430 [Candidatus Xenobiia bacterium LiM19]
MAPIGHGYGSEFHLLRYLGRHRNKLNERVNELLGAEEVFWLDFNSKEDEKYYDINVNLDSGARIEVKLPDEELTGINFLSAKELGYACTPTWVKQRINDDNAKLVNPKLNWKGYWPTGRGIMNWDSIALAKKADKSIWLLCEAKAHTKEIISKCNAKDPDSIKLIHDAFEDIASKLLLFKVQNDWENKYYQFANRLAVLHFLMQNDIDANLLFIYFMGDLMKRYDLNDNEENQVSSNTDISPTDKNGWDIYLKMLHDAFNLEEKRIKSKFEMYELIRKADGGSIGVYELFLPVVA